MSYPNQMILNVGKNVTMVAAANTSLYKMTVPEGMRIHVQEIITRVSEAAGATTSAAVKLLKGTTLLKQTTGVGISAVIGVTKKDPVATLYDADRVVTVSNVFEGGDILEIQVAVTATTTGKFDIDLVIGLDNT